MQFSNVERQREGSLKLSEAFRCCVWLITAACSNAKHVICHSHCEPNHGLFKKAILGRMYCTDSSDISTLNWHCKCYIHSTLEGHQVIVCEVIDHLNFKAIVPILKTIASMPSKTLSFQDYCKRKNWWKYQVIWNKSVASSANTRTFLEQIQTAITADIIVQIRWYLACKNIW